jgi:ubiquitin C-terminal hydrolase
VKYVYANITALRGKKLNPHANTLAAVKMNDVNPQYENKRKIQRLLTNQNPGFFFFLTSISQILFSKYLVTFLLQSPSSSEVSL